MNRNNDKPIKEIIAQFFSNDQRLGKRYQETALMAYWPELMGIAISNRTKEIYIRDRKLFVRIDSSVVKNELMMLKSQIVQKLNEHTGKQVIEDIFFL